MIYVYIDESSFNKTSYIYGAIAVDDENVSNYRNQISTLRYDLLNDPLYRQFINQEHLVKSFHYTQDHRDVKNRFQQLLSQLSFESFLYVTHDVTNELMKESRITYLKFLNDFLSQRYHDSIRYIGEKDESLGSINWPKDIVIDEKYKQDDDILSISDYVIGIFRKLYAHEYKETEKAGCVRDYEYIRNKIRFIKDTKIKKPYTRRNPLLF